MHRPTFARAAVFIVSLVAVTACSSGSDGATPKTTTTTQTTATTTSTTSTGAATTSPASTPYAGYRSKEHAGTTHWICHPDLADDPCRDLSTTVIGADGTRTVTRAEAATDPPIDCFYVYPTTSDDQGTNADFDVDASEIDTVRAQVARYASTCRVFAPAYRQVPLVGLAGGGRGPARKGWALAYGDVVDAWKTYMSTANEGRGVVLIGHSQGSGHLKALLESEIDPSPALRKRLVSAILLGTTVGVPTGEAVGGDLHHIPACARATSTGCLISYSSYPADKPPSGAIFAKSPGAGREAVCVDPTDLAGGDGLADAVLPTKNSLLGSIGAVDGVTTPFVSYPGVLGASCTTTGAYHYLAFAPTGKPDARPVNLLLRERLGPAWGLHLGDGNLAQDDLIEVVRRQAAAYTA